MSKITKIKPEYLPFTQQKTLCVACAIQWILYRRKLKLISQEKIGKELKFIGNFKYRDLYIEKLNLEKKVPKLGYGTKATDKSMKKMLKKFKIKLNVKYYPVSKIDEPVKFIKKNLNDGNDLLIITNMRPLNPKKKYGHAMVVVELKEGKKNEILLGDPSYNSKKFWWVDLNKILKGMTDKYDGKERGFFVFAK